MTFKEVWKKAIEKYSPKKAEKLNEVSFRFQQKLNEIAQTGKRKDQIDNDDDADFNVGKSRIPGHDDEEEKIKFVSMIDQKPIKPSYLELVPMKDFTRKEQKANKATKESRDNNK